MPGNLHFIDRYYPEDLDKAPAVLFVFGDNMEGWGTKGQAIIRGKPNAVGIPTKWAPRLSPAAFFSDGDFLSIERVCSPIFYRLREHLEKGGTIVWPADGIGTGLAKLSEKAPRIAAHFNQELEKLKEIAS